MSGLSPTRERVERATGPKPAARDELARMARPLRRVETLIGRWLTERALPEGLRDALVYAVLAPGKRMRPMLVLLSCRAVAGRDDDALVPAAAVELVHAHSLVHDDLPAMDDDDLRRGRPTLHRHASEAMALLAGDALLGLAMELVATRTESAELAQQLVGELARAANDLIAGQVYDTVPGAIEPGLSAREQLELIHRHKTGALIRAACRMGGLAGGASERQLAALTQFGAAVGHMFQVVDDVLDVTQTTEQLGKTAGKDAAQAKLTYPSLLGVEGSRNEIDRLRQAALDALEPLGSPGAGLRQLTQFLAVRTR